MGQNAGLADLRLSSKDVGVPPLLWKAARVCSPAVELSLRHVRRATGAVVSLQTPGREERVVTYGDRLA